jgi:hypothetical protein
MRKTPSSTLTVPVLRGGIAVDSGLSASEEAFVDEVRDFPLAHPAATVPEDGTDAGYGSGAHSRAFTSALGERG